MKKEELGELRLALGDNGIKEFGNQILKAIEDIGLGVLSKNDFEALMFHHIALNIDSKKVKDNYDWMRILKITPSKYRSVQQIRTAKYRNLDLNNVDNQKNLISVLESTNVELEDKDKGLIRLYISDVHIQMFIEKIVVGNKSSIDYKLNSNVLVIKFEAYLRILDLLLKHKDIKADLLTELNKDRSKFKLDKQLTSLEAVWSDLKRTITEESIKTIASEAILWSLKAVKNKLMK